MRADLSIGWLFLIVMTPILGYLTLALVVLLWIGSEIRRYRCRHEPDDINHSWLKHGTWR